MSFAPNFQVSQSLGNVSVATFTDTSTGSDVAIVGRTISLLKADGTYLLQNGVWALASPSKDENILNRDYGLYGTVNWVDVSGNVLYSKSYTMCFVGYTKNFINGLTQQETALPNISGGVNYWDSKAKLQTLVDDADQAISMGNDYVKAQSFLDEAYYIINNQNRFF
jgi:hypothetical protein